MKLFFTLLAAASCLFGVTLRDLQQQPAAITYKDGLRLYVFPAAGDKPKPALLWLHGGGWTSGSAEAGFPHARYFASRGMVGISAEYRLAKPGGPFVSDAIADCKAALQYLGSHAKDLHIDPARITVAGDSAGAHLAAALADQAGALVLYNGIYDLTDTDRTKVTGSAEASKAVSPLFHIPARMPPAVLLHGWNDTSVSPDQSQRYAAATKSRLIMVENARHAFVLPGYTAPEHQVVDAIREGDHFLQSIGYLTGPATLETASPLPVSRPGSWMTRHEKILDRVKQGNVDVVFLGDSITQNYEKANPPDEDFKPTWDRFYGDRNAVNLGISGDTTEHLVWRIEHGELDGIKPKLAVILIGTNDLGHGVPAEKTKAGIDEVVYLTHVKVPSAKILLLGILPSNKSEQRSADSAAVNTYLAAKYAASSFVTFTDIGDIFRKNGKLDDGLFYDPRLKTPAGALHPDTKGQRMMAETIEPLACKLLNDCKPR